MSRVVCWFSCGAASAVATKITLNAYPDAEVLYCATGAEHEDNKRFIEDCQIWFGKSVFWLKSKKYRDTWDVWEKERYISGIHGAPCTRELKFIPRLSYQRPDDLHVFGYTADKLDVARANRFRINYPELVVHTPLIAASLTKEAVLDLILRAGISLPAMYLLGFWNNNCIPCVKATSPDYWSLIRQEFPVVFQRMVEVSRELGVRLARLHGERIFIDEIPLAHPTTNPLQPNCDFLCALAERDL